LELVVLALLEVGRVHGARDGLLLHLHGRGGQLLLLGQHKAAGIRAAEHAIVVIVEVVLTRIKGRLPAERKNLF
jgi:hypothetical protein